MRGLFVFTGILGLDRGRDKKDLSIEISTISGMGFLQKQRLSLLPVFLSRLCQSYP